MENLMGLLRIHVTKGVNLAIRDVRSSDPYVTIRMGRQFDGVQLLTALFIDFCAVFKLKTRVVKHDVNPEWDEDLTLFIADPHLPIQLSAYDRDTFSPDISPTIYKL
ncbi:hypothetical protein Patl1_21294 [Pistacia atlantica]|uniref:Uncharacterized protein n=1 Tax=Pistacia atlantica TaxID=434234 RepID=A0ACC1BK37_9ROSI|nr:hypothetical protein Patl1_21294 [Pistacia atlantica]